MAVNILEDKYQVYVKECFAKHESPMDKNKWLRYQTNKHPTCTKCKTAKKVLLDRKGVRLK